MLHRTLSMMAAGLLFIALFTLPIGYYTFMRIAVTGIAAYWAYLEAHREQKLWLVAYIAAAILFNPLIPIYLRNKDAWIPFDAVFGLLFLISAFRKPVE